MGRHREPRRAARRSLLPALQNAALPVAILLVVGVIAFASPALRGADEGGDGSLTAAEPTGSAEPSRSAKPGKADAPGRNRAETELVFKAEIVPATRFERKPEPQIPENFVRVRRSALAATTFTVASYNVLGYGHTAPGGNRPGWADGHTRMRWATSLLRARGVDVVGFQEFQVQQFQTFNAVAGGEYAVYPGAAGGREGVRNSIAWRRSEWALVEAHSIQIPYFGGSPLPMPYLLLRNLATGQKVWFANFHNPADAHGPAQRHRDRAMALEVALFNQLKATGHPVVATGDFNERDVWLCKAAAQAGMRSADGGYADASGCHAPQPMQVDWILGDDRVAFAGYSATRAGLAARTSDHPLVSSDATVASPYRANRCLQKSRRSAFVFCPPA